jgi:hypothetical protein
MMPVSCAWGDTCACPAWFQARVLGSGPNFEQAEMTTVS